MTPTIGSVNETFIRRDTNDLLPGRTVVVAAQRSAPEYWSAEGTMMWLSSKCQIHAGFESEREEQDRIAEFWHLHDVRIILIEYLHFAARYISLAKQCGVKLFAHAHGFDCSALLRHDNWISRYRQLNEAAGVIVVSAKMKDALVKVGVRSEIIKRIYCGVEAKPFHARPDRAGQVRFLSVSRFTGKKGHIFLLEAFRRALQVASDIELHLVGDGELMEAARQFIETFSLGHAVRLYGFQAPAVVQKVMNECDVYVQHSVVCRSTGDEEGLPVSVLEAMAAGLPVVSTIHGGIPEAVEHGVTGYLVTERDVASMASKIVELASNYELRLAMGEKGAARIEARFTWEHERQSLLQAMGLMESSATVDS